jgi:hypothetical protein
VFAATTLGRAPTCPRLEPERDLEDIAGGPQDPFGLFIRRGVGHDWKT